MVNIPPNGTVMVNGTQITSFSSGDIRTYNGSDTSCSGASKITSIPGALHVGRNNSWSLVLTFDKPVNDLIIGLVATGEIYNENFIFNSNGGAVSISSNNSCFSTINGNEIFSGLGSPATGGGGVFKIHAPNAYTSLNVQGQGGQAGTLMAICSFKCFFRSRRC